jgi:hypothetical protein
MISKITVAAAIFVVTSLASPALAQPPAGQGRAGGTPAPPQNLQVLPRDTPRADLLAAMRAFTSGLGVQCNYCHVQEGQGGRNDFAADEKPQKNIARAMMRISMQANQTIASAVTAKPAAELVRVQCWTCHRGKAIPEVAPPPPAPPAAAAPR